MKWLKRKLRDWLSDDVNEISSIAKARPARLGIVSDNTISQSGLSFTLYTAVGGHILETRVYNQKTDRQEGTLYMIYDDEDFAKQVAQAIMLESMKS